MKHCPNCRKLNLSEAEFCERCGERIKIENKGVEETISNEENEQANIVSKVLEEESEQEVRDVFLTEKEMPSIPPEQNEPDAKQSLNRETDNSNTEVPEKKPSHKFFWIIAAFILLLLVTLGYQKNKFKPEKQVAAFMEVLQSGEEDKISSILQTENEKFEITEKNVKPLIAYLKEHQHSIGNIRNQLVEEGYAKQAPLSHGVIYSKKEGFWGKMQFYVEPLEVEIQNSNPKLVLTLDGDSLVSKQPWNEKMASGPIIPGKHIFKGALKENNQKYVMEKAVDIVEKGIKVDMSCHIVNIAVTSNRENGTAYLDGEKIGELQNGQVKIGPVLVTQDSMFYLKQNNGKKSNIIKIKNYLYGSGEKLELIEMTVNYK